MARPPLLQRRYDTPSGETVHDRLVTAIGSGMSMAKAAEYAGVDAATVSKWLSEGLRLSRDVPRGRRDPYQRAQVAFAEDATAAVARSQLRLVQALESLAHGGIVVQKTKEVETHTPGGVERRFEETNERTLPDVKAITWLLERIDSQQWHLASRVELSGPAGGPVEVNAVDSLIGDLERIAERSAAAHVALGELARANGHDGEVD